MHFFEKALPCGGGARKYFHYVDFYANLSGENK